jgi:predicted AAA+ superfamily ATPase
MSYYDILLDQQREFKALLERPYVPRRVVIPSGLDGLVRVVIGPRRAGKSFFSAHLAREDSFDCGYVNFDDERLATVDTDGLLAALDSVYGEPPLILLDEIQNVPNWELWVNRLQRQGRRLILTGSNAHLLSSELATHLTGRHFSIPMLPFSFQEYLEAKAKDRSFPMTEAERREACRSYSRCGGFPEVVMKDMDGGAYLKTLTAAVIHKDIVTRHRLRAPQALDALALCLLSNPGGVYSYRRMGQATGCRSVHTLKKYIGFLEQAFLCFTIPAFSFKAREQAASLKKAYAVDNGLIGASGFQSSANHGRLMENLVAIELFKQQLAGELKVFYWSDPQKAEVDFVVFRNNRVEQLIQVCVDAEKPKTEEREIRSLLKASRALSCDNLLLLTESQSGKQKESWHGMEGEVRRMPISDWLIC